MLQLVHKAVAEAIGTFAIVFAGCGGIMVAERFPQSVPSLSIPLIFGLTVSSMIYALGHISGAHFNPAVTLAFAFGRHFPKKEIIFYWVGQFGGAFLAIGILSLLLPPGSSFGATAPLLPAFKAVLWEMILTFFLMFVIMAVATDTRAVGTMAGLAIGSTVTLCAYFGGPVTGASMNPARSLAPAIFEGRMDVVWIYFVGPCLGALFAAFLYEWIRCDPEKKNPKGCC